MSKDNFKKPLNTSTATDTVIYYQQNMNKKSTNQIDSETLKSIKSALNNKKLELEKELRRTGDNMRDEAEKLPDYSDQASQEASLTFNNSINTINQQYLHKITIALNKIQKGSFSGYCTGCSCPIGINRLMIEPSAELCVSCKSEQEHIEKQYKGG